MLVPPITTIFSAKVLRASIGHYNRLSLTFTYIVINTANNAVIFASLYTVALIYWTNHTIHMGKSLELDIGGHEYLKGFVSFQLA